jgi:(2Fe-2S) ferredoxin/SAM-dependent methyltransferase
MQPYRLHVFVCDQRKPEGAPCCSANGSIKVIERLRAEVGKQGLADQVQVTTCGSIGLCERGPNMVVYPDGVWYSRVRPDDVAEIVSEHFGKGHVVERLANLDQAAVRAEIDTNKKRMLAALKSRDESGALPDDLQQAIRGFQDSRPLLTAIELDVFTAVGQGATASAVAEKVGTAPRATEALLNALVALQVLVKNDGRYACTPVASRYLVEGAPNDSRAALMHIVHLWPRWSTLTECVRHGTSVTYTENRERPDDWTEAFIAAMHKNAAGRAPQVARAVGLDGVTRVLDVGGGSGAYSIAFAQTQPGLRADLLDLAGVLPIARRHIEAAKLVDRIGLREGDLRVDDFGSGYDLVFISAICHMLSPDENRSLLERAFRALSPRGRIVIQDFILAPDKTAPKSGALFALNMLVGTRAGSSYSEAEYAEWLRGVGCGRAEKVALPGTTALMIGHRA